MEWIEIFIPLLENTIEMDEVLFVLPSSSPVLVVKKVVLDGSCCVCLLFGFLKKWGVMNRINLMKPHFLWLVVSDSSFWYRLIGNERVMTAMKSQIKLPLIKKIYSFN